ncbi:SGNH/GDSL hydrolase family protein [Marinactinospora thermotolerans]|uniref:Lysophospholipase L1 n=1 Tax=Marinactinospora thermotolerans DSM 45154 TaxID=1122192 RepID=A0A1T4LPJ1_9ACTN|nr:SGNH/GDSL hydrolase family protein [Marinactinospora thermotolerans]SJZ56640.1 Lysophospholipase L1 [Marinactinospora thermotolerans DSM 45154]
MSGFSIERDIVSYVAIGDSFTEGMSDPYPDSTAVPTGRYRGWADRLAEHMADHIGEVRYANLAVRGKLIRQIVAEQLPRAIELRPDLVTICAGGNDIIRPGSDPDQVAEIFEGAIGRLRETGADVLIFTGFDTGFQPVMRRFRGKIATYNMHLRGIADRYGCQVVDLWSMKIFADRQAWDADRLHLSPEGHRRLALRVAEVLGLPADEDWNAPWPALPPMAWHVARQQDLHWAREFLVPWIGRRLTGRSSGDGIRPKRPNLERLR